MKSSVGQKLSLYLLILALFFSSRLNAAEGVSLPYLTPLQLEEIMLFILNQERKNSGLSELENNSHLKEIAQKHSAKMTVENTLSHQFPDYADLETRLVKEGLSFTAFGENVARGSKSTLRLVHDALMKSPMHRDNILNPSFKEIGIGIVFLGETLYITQVFASLYTPLPPSMLEKKISLALENTTGLYRGRPRLQPGKIYHVCKAFNKTIFSLNDPAELAKNYPGWGVKIITFQTMAPEVIDSLTEYISRFKPREWDVGIDFDRPKTQLGGMFVLTLCCLA